MREPPGGPPDSTPPHILVTRPESGAIVPNFSGDAVIDFDEVVDEMAGGGGGGTTGGASAIGGIGRQIILSPVNGDVKVSWHRRSIRVKPAEGWKNGRIYNLQVLPGISDLRHNVAKQGSTVVFSTGPVIPHAVLSGIALQWVEQRALVKGVIRAARAPDSAAYIALTDSGGTFSLAQIPSGTYRVAAIQDQNGNRRIDRGEAFDSFAVKLDTSVTVIFWTFVHDTTPPRLRAADPVDSLVFRLSFSQSLDPEHPPDTTAVRLFALPDTSPVALAGVWPSAVYDSLQAKARATADSLRRARDTTKRGADTAKAGRAPPGAVRRPSGGGAAPLTPPPARPDTGRIARLLRKRPVPADRFVARAARPLTPGAKYLVRVRQVRNLSARSGDSQQVFEAPERPKADTAGAKPAKPR